METVKIYTANSKIEADSVKMFLESNDIKAMIRATSDSHGVVMGQYGAASAPLDWFDIHVLEKDAEKANKILDEKLSPIIHKT